jgi:hypothetical protein
MKHLSSKLTHIFAAAMIASGAGLAGAASAAEDEGPPPQYRNPQGSVVAGATIFAGFGGGRDAVVGVGASVGYAVFTGVLPSVRGLVLVGGEVGAELALNLTLTPPISYFLVPFLVGEGGRRFHPQEFGWIYGVGGGLYIGEPESRLGLQVGWMWRRIDNGETSLDGSGPIVALSIRL